MNEHKSPDQCTCQTVGGDYSDHMHESATQSECPVYTAGKAARAANATLSSKTVSVPEEVMHRIYNTLSYYANVTSYEAPRIGGVAAGCPRGETPTPESLV